MTASPVSILLCGEFLSDRLGASYERAFLQLGHRVTRCDLTELAVTAAPWLRNRLGQRATSGSLRLRRAGSRHLNAGVLESAWLADPDLVLLLNGDLVMPETVTALRHSGSRVFIFHADNPLPPHRSSRPETIPAALACDCYLIWSRQVQDNLRRLGVRRVEYLPFGWDEAVFPHAPQTSQLDHDMVFIGGWDPVRESLLEAVAGRFDLKIWGPPYWATRTRRNSAVRRCWQGGAVREGEAAEVMARSRIVLNILRRQNLPDGTVMRTFEVPGCGAFLLSSRTSGAAEIFPEDVAGAYFGSTEECCAQIERFLQAPERRQEIARAAHDIVSYNHRYVDRAQRIIDVYREMGKRADALGAAALPARASGA